MIRSLSHTTLAVLFLALLGCGGADSDGQARIDKPARSVTIAVAERLPASSFDEQMGSVVARNRAEIETKVQARVDRIPVALGASVRAGDLLAELDTREYRARAQQARALFEQSAQDLVRYETLLAQNAATQQEYDGAKARRTVAEAGLQEAEAMLTYARITAPFAGTITRKSIEAGDLALPGRPLFVLEDGSALQFVVAISESHRGRVAVGETLGVAVQAMADPLPGVVEEISPSADPLSRTFIAKLGLPSQPGVRPGQYGRVLIPAADEPSVYIPAAALVNRGQLELVYVLSDDNRAMLRLVRTGGRLGDRIEVLSGLSEGERVVTAGAAGLADGDRVEVAS